MFERVREHIPLEQGLRQEQHLCAECNQIRQRAYSIRTRIKTRNVVIVVNSVSIVREHIPLEQGLRPPLCH